MASTKPAFLLPEIFAGLDESGARPVRARNQIEQFVAFASHGPRQAPGTAPRGRRRAEPGELS